MNRKAHEVRRLADSGRLSCDEDTFRLLVCVSEVAELLEGMLWNEEANAKDRAEKYDILKERLDIINTIMVSICSKRVNFCRQYNLENHFKEERYNDSFSIIRQLQYFIQSEKNALTNYDAENSKKLNKSIVHFVGDLFTLSEQNIALCENFHETEHFVLNDGIQYLRVTSGGRELCISQYLGAKLKFSPERFDELCEAVSEWFAHDLPDCLQYAENWKAHSERLREFEKYTDLEGLTGDLVKASDGLFWILMHFSDELRLGKLLEFALPVEPGVIRCGYENGFVFIRQVYPNRKTKATDAFRERLADQYKEWAVSCMNNCMNNYVLGHDRRKNVLICLHLPLQGELLLILTHGISNLCARE